MPGTLDAAGERIAGRESAPVEAALLDVVAVGKLPTLLVAAHLSPGRRREAAAAAAAGQFGSVEPRRITRLARRRLSAGSASEGRCAMIAAMAWLANHPDWPDPLPETLFDFPTKKTPGGQTPGDTSKGTNYAQF